MPELPEVETVMRGIAPTIVGQTITDVHIRAAKLRWPIPDNLNKKILNQRLKSIKRRGKYLLFEFADGTLILHLGMSGRILLTDTKTKFAKHDHVDIAFKHTILRFRDPRKFGAILWCDENIEMHPLLKSLGPEPLSRIFTAQYLKSRAGNRNIAIKNFIMDSKIVVGVGNIYAAESLFLAGIAPQAAAGKISLARYTKLVTAIKQVLRAAINAGGTTLRDYQQSNGELGYFHHALQVYGKAGKPCPKCKTILVNDRIGQRSSVHCPKCQK